jgi:hypothetical protein
VGNTVRIGFIWLRIYPVTGTCEHDSELCDFHEDGKLTANVSDYNLFKNDSSPCSMNLKHATAGNLK